MSPRSPSTQLIAALNVVNNVGSVPAPVDPRVSAPPTLTPAGSCVFENDAPNAIGVVVAANPTIPATAATPAISAFAIVCFMSEICI